MSGTKLYFEKLECVILLQLHMLSILLTHHFAKQGASAILFHVVSYRRSYSYFGIYIVCVALSKRPLYSNPKNLVCFLSFFNVKTIPKLEHQWCEPSTLSVHNLPLQHQYLLQDFPKTSFRMLASPTLKIRKFSYFQLTALTKSQPIN